MLETKDLILDKGRFEDWEAMYRNVWRHPVWRLNGKEAKR